MCLLSIEFAHYSRNNQKINSMITRESIIREFLNDPLMVEKGYLAEGEADTIKLNLTTNSKMIDLVVKIVNSKFNEDSDAKTTRDINNLLNTTDTNLKK